MYQILLFYLLFSNIMQHYLYYLLGMTRARKKLFLSYRKMLLTADFKVEKVSPSRFLSLLPEDVPVLEYNPYREYKGKKNVKKRKLKSALEEEKKKK